MVALTEIAPLRRASSRWGPSWEGNRPFGKSFWPSSSGGNPKPRCSGNLLSLWDALEHSAMPQASKYSSGWVIRTCRAGTTMGIEWELWQCLNATALGLQVFLGWDRERESEERLMGRRMRAALARKSCYLSDSTAPSESSRHPAATHQLF